MFSRLHFHNFVPTQIDFILQENFVNEIKEARKLIKNYFIEKNKQYLEENNYSVKVNGFIIDSEDIVNKIHFQIELFDCKNEKVAIDFLKIN